VAKHLLIVETNPSENADDEFNRWYDEVHIPELLEIDGFVDAKRFILADAQMGRSRPDQRYLALYEIEAETAQAALDAFNARAPQLRMSPTLRQGRGEVRIRMYTSLEA
jgi:hypothetical protein